MRVLLLFIAIVLTTASSSEAAFVRLIEDRPGQYRIVGVGLQAVGALDLTVSYDTATLQLSQVTKGTLLQDMLFVSNPNQAGEVRVAAVGRQAVFGSGTLVSLGGTVTKSPALITGFVVNLKRPNGEVLAVSSDYPRGVVVDNVSSAEPIPDLTSSSTDQRRSGGVASGTFELPPPWSAGEDSPPPIDKTEPYILPLPEVASSSQSSQVHSEQTSTPYIEKQRSDYQSIQELFSQYEGVRSLGRMAELFNRGSALKQRPKILLADGESSLDIEFPGSKDEASSYAIQNARLIWIKQNDEGRIGVRCIPEQDALSANVLFLGKKEMIRVPLTVAPSISLAGIDVMGDELLPKLDLDGDGERTWKDDYILVANILASYQKKQAVD